MTKAIARAGSRVAKGAATALSSAVTPAAGFLLIQLAGALSVLYGVAWWSIPIALIIGGVAAIVAIELRPKNTPQVRTEEDERIRKLVDKAVSDGKNPFADKTIPMSEKWIRYVELFRLK